MLEHLVVILTQVSWPWTVGAVVKYPRAIESHAHWHTRNEKRARGRVFTGFLAEQAGFEPAVGY